MTVAPATPQPPTDITLSNTDLAPNSASNTLGRDANYERP